jgi:large subunit ribosomal protein L9
MIEVILKESVEHLGNRGEIVKVADGYARNYLLPRQLALAVTPGNKRQIEFERKRAAEREAAERNDASSLATRLAEVECVVARRVGEKETLYGSVTAADVADALSLLGFEIDKRKIQLDEPLKQLGEFSVPVKLHRDMTAQVRVLVVKSE